jgi:hypothetical protein
MPVPNLAKWYHLSETCKACPRFEPITRVSNRVDPGQWTARDRGVGWLGGATRDVCSSSKSSRANRCSRRSPGGFRRTIPARKVRMAARRSWLSVMG